jgi:hypothetical protein
MSNQQDTDPLSTSIIRILPSSARYVEQMEALLHTAYGSTPGDDECLTADMFLEHIVRFPEGQYIAVDGDDRVIGLTASLRMNFDPRRPVLSEPWWVTIGYG